MPHVFEPMPVPAVPVHGENATFAVHRVFCVGQNYADHAVEMGASGREAPFFFMKPPSSLVPVASGREGQVPYPDGTQSLHHEAELVVAIGLQGADIDTSEAADFIYGYAVGLDLTRRDLQAALKEKGRPWEIAKGFEASGPIGPITPKEKTGELVRGGIRLDVNGQTRQHGDLGQMIWRVNEIIAHLSRHWMLMPGDLVFTGTPAGVSAIERGDVLSARIDGLEALQVKIV